MEAVCSLASTHISIHRGCALLLWPAVTPIHRCCAIGLVASCGTYTEAVHLVLLLALIKSSRIVLLYWKFITVTFSVVSVRKKFTNYIVIITHTSLFSESVCYSVLLVLIFLFIISLLISFCLPAFLFHSLGVSLNAFLYLSITVFIYLIF